MKVEAPNNHPTKEEVARGGQEHVERIEAPRALGNTAPESVTEDGITAHRLPLKAAEDPSGVLAERYLGSVTSAVYLIRPDQHVAARWNSYVETAMRAALRRACAKE